MIKQIVILFIFISTETNLFAQDEKYKITQDFTKELNTLLAATEKAPEDYYFTAVEPFDLNGKGYLKVKLKYHTDDSSFYYISFFARIKEIKRIYYDGLTIGFAFNNGKVRYLRTHKGGKDSWEPIEYSFMPIANIKDDEKAKAAVKKLETLLEAVKNHYY